MTQGLPIQILIPMIGNLRMLNQRQQAVLIQIHAGERIAHGPLEIAFVEDKPLSLRILHVDFVVLDNLRHFGSLADIEAKLLLIWQCLIASAGNVDGSIRWRGRTWTDRRGRGIGCLQART